MEKAMMQTIYADEIIKELDAHLYIQLTPKEDETVSKFCQRLTGIFEGKEYQVVKMTCFGSLSSRIVFEEELAGRMKKVFPISWIEGENCSGSFMNGLQLWATKEKVTYLETHWGAQASYFHDQNGQHLFVGDLRSEPSQQPELEYATLLQKLNSFLEDQGFTFTDIVRTWYYLDDILSWYDAFNRVRSGFFRQTGVFDTMIPASTGVSGKNKTNTAVTMELLAFKPQKGATITRVKSPLQNEAGDYGSSFSRAIRIDSPDHHWMSVSGTASILPSGETTHIGDLKNQILHSVDVVSKIIEQEGFMWADVTRATAYVKDKENLSILKDVLDSDLPYPVPLIVTQNTICRDDLLFEIELDLYS